MKSIINAAARRASLPLSEIKKISGREKLQMLKDAVSHIVGEVQAKDTTLANSWKKTMASATTELAQLPGPMSRLMQKPGSFGIFLQETNKFIVWNNYVWSVGAAGGLFEEAMEEYVAYKVGLKRAGKGVTALQKTKRMNKPTVNIGNVGTKVSTIISTY